jgi:MFS family permease
MVLALACFLGGYATNSLIPVTLNYVIECFKGHAAESAAIMGLYRLAFSLSLPFFVPAWIAKVGFGWCLGMAAFFSIFAFGGIVLLLWKGEAIRQLSFKSISSNEGGMRIMEKEEDSAEV